MGVQVPLSGPVLYWVVAQLVERGTVNPVVVGSMPTGPAKFSVEVRLFHRQKGYPWVVMTLVTE